jgi:peptidoglycan/xylan/chitin deacetylase (PgdA/CDA1 family)
MGSIRSKLRHATSAARARGRAAIDRRHPPRAVVLTYHRVGPPSANYWPMTISEANFREHMEFLAGLRSARALGEVVGGAPRGRRSPLPVAVTFDDGYEDNVRLALPILLDHDIPVTFFLVAGAVGSSAEFWWDDLDRMLLLPGRLPDRLEVEVDGEALGWDLGGDAVYSPQQFAAQRGWRMLDSPPTVRHRIYQELWERLRRLPASESAAVIETLRRSTQTPAAARPGNRPLTEDQAMQLARLPGVEIGSHSMEHPYLPGLPADRQVREVQRSREVLTEMAGREIPSFSYPFGASSPQLRAAVGGAGYRAAFTTSPRPLRAGDDPFALPRLSVDDCDADGLARRLRPLIRRW